MRELLTRRPLPGIATLVAATVLAGCTSTVVWDGATGGGDRPSGYGSDAVERWTAAQVGCLRDAGWDAIVIDDGYEVRDVTPEGRDEFVSARDECEHRVGPRPAQPRPDDREILAQYRALLELRECLEREGHHVPEPPPPEQFVESWAAGPWHPYAPLAASLDATEWERLNRVCPQPEA